MAKGTRGGKREGSGLANSKQLEQETFITDMLANYDSFPRGDLQGAVEAFAMNNKINDDLLMREIDSRAEQMKNRKWETVRDGRTSYQRKLINDYRDKNNRYRLYKKGNGQLELTIYRGENNYGDSYSGSLVSLMGIVKDNWNKK